MAHERTARRIAAILLVVFLVGVAGVVPVPASWFTPVAGPDAYPCASHACGCGSVEDCFSGCGCASQADLLAWLDRTGKDAPPWWAPIPQDQPTTLASDPPACALCHADEPPSSAPAPAPTSSCSVEPGTDGLSDGLGVTTISALSCRGLPMVYLLAAPLFLGAQPLMGEPMIPRQIGVLTIEASRPCVDPAPEIPTPPPRPVV